MNSEEKIIKRLEQRKINPTAIRILVLGTMLKMHNAFSLADLEQELETVDKSTLFRTITLFHEHLLIHSIDDGSGSMKYSVCNEHCNCSIEDLHAHFFCTQCHTTTCLEDLSIPKVSLAKGFKIESVNFVLKGLCVECNH